MATQRNGTVFSNILNVLRGNRTGLDAEKNREKLLTNQPSTPYKAIEDKQQEFLDVQSSKIAYLQVLHFRLLFNGCCCILFGRRLFSV